jgi:hypothetical protein
MDVTISEHIAAVPGEWVRYATKKRTAHFFLDNDADAINAESLCGGHRGAHGEAPDWELARYRHAEGVHVVMVCPSCWRCLEAEAAVGLRRQLRRV